jgi:hypothetical protein
MGAENIKTGGSGMDHGFIALRHLQRCQEMLSWAMKQKDPISYFLSYERVLSENLSIARSAILVGL